MAEQAGGMSDTSIIPIRPSIDIVQAMLSPRLFGKWFSESSWRMWQTILRAAFALPMSDGDLALFAEVSGGRKPPPRRVTQLWVKGGRRGGKDSVASLIATYCACIEQCHLGHLRPGERAMVLCIASDRTQARIVLRYIQGYFEQNEAFAKMVLRMTPEGIELSNGCDVVVATNDFRGIRGSSILLAILDEVAFWRDENSRNPDTEVYAAVRDGMSFGGSMIIGISTPHIQGGLLFDRFRQYYGKDDDRVLFVSATSLQLRPTEWMRRKREEGFADDAVIARSEYDVEWRKPSDMFITAEKLAELVDAGIAERACEPGVQYVGAFDAALGGYGDNVDSFTAAIAHRMNSGILNAPDILVLDAVLEIEPPFNTTDAVARCAELFQRYGVTVVFGDGLARGFVEDGFTRHYIEYRLARKAPRAGETEDTAPPMVRTEIYRQALNHMFANCVRLLDDAKTNRQILGLRRRAKSGGGEDIDHLPGAHDDRANAACLAMVKAVIPVANTFYERMGNQEYFFRAHNYDPPCRQIGPCAWCDEHRGLRY
jgi:hypothetical protein